MLTALFRQRWYPSAFQAAAGLAAVVAVYFGLRPVRHAELNPGAALVWQLWWPVLPFLGVALARAWCAVCPFPWLGDALQRLPGRGRPLAPHFVRGFGPWFAALSLLALGVSFLLFSFESDGRLTAVVLLAFAAMAASTALAWRGRVWCRFLCPLGMLLRLYARLSPFSVRPANEASRGAAVRAAARCPLLTTPVAAERTADCVVCGDCFKAGSRAVVGSFRRPAVPFALEPVEAAAVGAVVGLLLADAFRMTPLYLDYMAAVVSGLGWSYDLALGVALALGVLATLSLQAGIGLLRRGAAFWASFGRLGAVLLPLALALHLALSLQHLTGAPAAFTSVLAEAALVAPGHMPPSDAYGTSLPLKLSQFALVGGALLVGWTLVLRRRQGEGAAVTAGLAVPALAGGFIFWQPMAAAC